MNRRSSCLCAVLAILLVGAVGVCLLDGDHNGVAPCHSMLSVAAWSPGGGLLLVGALAMPPAPPHPKPLPARTAPAPV